MNTTQQLSISRPGLSTEALVMSDTVFSQMRDFIYTRTGIYYPDVKKYLLEGRLTRRVRLLGLHSFDEYLALLQSSTSKAELQEFYDHITINETYFFRNEGQFHCLEKVLVPALMAQARRSKTKSLRIWSAASSSGEEAYTLAMIYLEKIRPLYPGLRLEVVGTDINREVVETARSGVYTNFSLRNMPPHYRAKYLHDDGPCVVVDDSLREYVRFENMNLYDRNAMRNKRDYDVIFCCNVMIYFDQASKIQVVSDLYDALDKVGYLFIGHSESLHGISKLFRLQTCGNSVVYSKEE